MERSSIHFSKITLITFNFKDKWLSLEKAGVTVIYTEKGLSIEQISLNCAFWQKELLPKLTLR